MTDETHLVDDLSLLVPSLKQFTLMKVADTLIRSDLEMYCNTMYLLFSKPLERLSDNIKQLPVPDCVKSGICDAVSCLYRQPFPLANSVLPSALKFNACGDLDMYKTFDGYMDGLLRGPRPPSTYLFDFLRDACDYHQDRCIHLTLCELLKWKRSKLEPSLRHARREVNIHPQDNDFWRYDIELVIKDVDDPAQWISFANMLNVNVGVTEFSFEGNIFSVTTPVQEPLLLWSEMTTLQKFEHAEEIFQEALEKPDMRFIQTMRYVNSSRMLDLIKRNLVSFILCFLVHPYYRHFLPDLQLVDEDLQLVEEEDELWVIEEVIDSLFDVGDYTNIADSLIQLWRYVSSRNDSLGDHVFHNIRTYLYDDQYGWDLQYDDDNAKEFRVKLRAVFPAIAAIVQQ